MGTSRVPPKPLPMPLRPALSCLLLAAASLAAAPSHAQPATTGAGAAALVPEAEHSGFQRTGRYEEVARLAAAFQARYPDQVQARSFGTTPEGRPMQLLVVTATGAFDPAEAKRRGLPVVLVQGGIHAGEIDGKDAGFLALRQVLEGQAAPGALDKLVWLFVPVFNVDGFERFGRWNRPNQRGPEQTGWRTTAQNFNLNRDYVKADSPEMQAMLGLVREWDPLATVDLHATNGAQFEHDISIQVEPLHAGDPGLRQVGRAWRDAVIADLAAQGSLPLPFYPSFVVHDDPASGFEDGCRRRASPTATSSCATAWACWWKPIRGSPIRSACGSPAIPSSRCSNRSPPTAYSGAAAPRRPMRAPRAWPGRPCHWPGRRPPRPATWTSVAMPTRARPRRYPVR